LTPDGGKLSEGLRREDKVNARLALKLAVAAKDSDNGKEMDGVSSNDAAASSESISWADGVTGREPAKGSERFGGGVMRIASDGVNRGVSLKARVGGMNRESRNGAVGLIGFVRVQRSEG
jgi:hypothetical protein